MGYENHNGAEFNLKDLGCGTVSNLHRVTPLV